MEKNRLVCVIGNFDCYAPVETIGNVGVITEVLNGVVDGVKYRDKFVVLFDDEYSGYREWIYSSDEITDEWSDYFNR